MPIVDITIRNTSYAMACDNGQEAHLQTLASRFDKRINALSKAEGKGSNDVRLLVLAALTLEDEIAELKSRLTENPLSPHENPSGTIGSTEDKVDVAVSRTMDAIADRLEKIAIQLENV